MDDIEHRAHGLTYIKGANKLVDAKVVRKFENGKIAEVHEYKAGRPIGNWYAYGYEGEIISHGFGVDATKYAGVLPQVDMGNSFLSINIEADYAFATLYLDNKSVFNDRKSMLDLSKAIFTEYGNDYKIEQLLLFDNEHEYTISKSAIGNNSYKVDTITGKNKKAILIH